MAVEVLDHKPVLRWASGAGMMLQRQFELLDLP